MNNQDFKFYVLRAITGKEREIQDYIERMREVEPLFRTNVREILLPLETTYQVNKNAKSGKSERVRPYYSGFVFVEAKLQGETGHLLRRIPNVLGFLGSETDPTPLSDEDVANIKAISDKLSEGPSVDDITFEIGERVKVNNGPFSGFYGEVTDVRAEHKKLKILVKVFGRETMMDVDYNQVEKEGMS